MNRIKKAFSNGKAFISFITGGDPDLETTKELILAMEEAGADLIEIGIPFSDPIAEGAVIQEANERALSSGCTTDKLFDAIHEIKEKVSVPLVFLTYINPIYTYGKERFFKRCVECGIDGIIVPDLPFEEKEELSQESSRYEVNLVSLIAPTSNERIRMIASQAEGFIYCVSSLGVTGVRTDIQTDITSMISMVREVTDTPCAIGFGISTPDQAKKFAALSDGAIVGSAIVKLVAQYGKESIEPVKTYVRDMKAAVSKA
ncbi:tryptophan synthase subunit alpha [Anaerocolumna chitinilytica]|uniref:Tryptophan synthase alpha chain n=1 Tax=Anaerocolumna chitinilytica TaxID=1727145 RepID=A0A7I8DMA4_9FIRM|nr:tryptophan synthase subunit alpha [Anaerocolumna chitinilytica]BCJ99510.1 tryptophan synthase alpha chain [Anaerocolumna chitinilytica]